MRRGSSPVAARHSALRQQAAAGSAGGIGEGWLKWRHLAKATYGGISQRRAYLIVWRRSTRRAIAVRNHEIENINHGGNASGGGVENRVAWRKTAATGSNVRMA